MSVDLLGSLRKEMGEDKIAAHSPFGGSPNNLECGSTVDNDPLQMKAFFGQIEEIKNKIIRAQKVTAEMQKVYGKSLEPREGDVLVECQKEIEKHQETQEQILTQTRGILAKIEQDNKTMLLDVKQHARTADIRMRTTQYAHLCRMFTDTLRKHQEMQSEFKRKQQKLLEEQYKKTHPKATNKELQRFLKDDEEKRKALQKELELAKDDARETLGAVTQRMEAMRLLEENIVMLSKLFLDMQNLVFSHGNILNKIEEEVGTATEHVENAMVEVKEAQKLADSIRKKRFFITLLITVFFLSGILIIYSFLT